MYHKAGCLFRIRKATQLEFEGQVATIPFVFRLKFTLAIKYEVLKGLKASFTT